MFKKEIFNKIQIDTAPVGWVFAFELSIKAYVSDYKVGEVPLISVDRLFGGSSTFQMNKWIKEYFKCYLWGLKFIKNKKNG